MLLESLGESVNLLFTFQTGLLGARRSTPVVIKGSRLWMEQYIRLEEFGGLFGGYVLWREASVKSKEIPGEALGVWGRRNVSRLRRILRERGAVFQVIEEEGPSQQIAVLSQSRSVG